VKFKVKFDTECCKGCGLCVKFCSKNILTLDKTMFTKGGVHPAVITDQDACVGCCNCAVMCPDAVITIEKIQESA